MQDGCKVYMDSYMASNGSWFMVTWTNFKNHLLEVGQTQNRETMPLQTLTTVDLPCVRTRMNRIHWNSILVEVTVTYDFTLRLGPVTTLHDFGKCFRTAFGHFLLGSHNFMGMALGTCMRWPLASDKHKQVWNHRIQKMFLNLPVMKFEILQL